MAESLRQTKKNIWVSKAREPLHPQRIRISKIEKSGVTAGKFHAFILAPVDESADKPEQVEISVGEIVAVQEHVMRVRESLQQSMLERAVLFVTVTEPHWKGPLTKEGFGAEYEVDAQMMVQENNLANVLSQYECWHRFTQGFWCIAPQSAQVYDEWSRTQVHEQGSPCVSEAVLQTTDGHTAAQAVCDAMDRARRFLATVATGVAEEYESLEIGNAMGAVVLGVIGIHESDQRVRGVLSGTFISELVALLTADGEVGLMELTDTVMDVEGFEEALNDYQQWHSSILAGVSPRRRLRDSHLGALAGSEDAETRAEAESIVVPFVSTPVKHSLRRSSSPSRSPVFPEASSFWLDVFRVVSEVRAANEIGDLLSVWSDHVAEAKAEAQVKWEKLKSERWFTKVRDAEIEKLVMSNIQQAEATARLEAEVVDYQRQLLAKLGGFDSEVDHSKDGPTVEDANNEKVSEEVSCERSDSAADRVHSSSVNVLPHQSDRPGGSTVAFVFDDDDQRGQASEGEDDDFAVPLFNRIREERKVDPAVLLSQLEKDKDFSIVRPIQFWNTTAVEKMVETQCLPEDVPLVPQHINDFLGRSHMVFATALDPTVLQSMSDSEEALQVLVFWHRNGLY